MNASLPRGDLDAARVHAVVARLEEHFRAVQRNRMHGVPMLHAALRVQAVGFTADVTPDVTTGVTRVLQGVLVTPWFMNLLRLPLDGPAATGTTPVDIAAPGTVRTRRIGAFEMDFIGADEPGFGRFEMCSLFSPMFEFENQAAAVSTAREVLSTLRGGAGRLSPASASTSASASGARPVAPRLLPPSRRGFLLGRSHGAR